MKLQKLVTLSASFVTEAMPSSMQQMQLLILNYWKAEMMSKLWCETFLYAGTDNCRLLQIKRAVQFLHDLGTVQYFDTEFLRNHIVINPQWIVNVMARVVSVKDSTIKVPNNNCSACVCDG